MTLEKEKITPAAAKAWRDKHKISQTTMAGLIGTGYGAYSAFERGITQEMHGNTMERLVAVIRGDAATLAPSGGNMGDNLAASLLAQDLENLAAKLRSTAFSPTTKAQIYEKAIRAAYETRMDAAAALRNRKPSKGAQALL